jgi:hypothetical protein
MRLERHGDIKKTPFCKEMSGRHFKLKIMPIYHLMVKLLNLKNDTFYRQSSKKENIVCIHLRVLASKYNIFNKILEKAITLVAFILRTVHF